MFDRPKAESTTQKILMEKVFRLRLNKDQTFYVGRAIALCTERLLAFWPQLAGYKEIEMIVNKEPTPGLELIELVGSDTLVPFWRFRDNLFTATCRWPSGKYYLDFRVP